MGVDRRRILQLKQVKPSKGSIVYWMSRDQRVSDNWALLYAQEIALEKKEPLAVVFCLTPQFLKAGILQYGFMLKGLLEVEKSLKKFNIPFFLLFGDPEEKIPAFVKKHQVGQLVCDFSPLHIARKWKDSIVKKIDISMQEVDAHNVIPCFFASSKQEFSARTFRPKLLRCLDDFLCEFPKVKKHPFVWKNTKEEKCPTLDFLQIDFSIKETKFLPGEKEAKKVFKRFLDKKINFYDQKKNDPTQDGLSNLSPYLHFGQISSQKVVLELVKQNKKNSSFFEEVFIRRELAENFCYYNPKYDIFEGFPLWAQKTLNEHRKDTREYFYSKKQLEEGKTHDEAWNAAQLEMVRTGKMHGYMRMYWAKKILEWTKSPEEALRIAIDLNDRYELDGRDPNGYVGIAWAIGGLHDRAWGERAVFGKIRWMCLEGLKKKFSIRKYCQNK